MDKLDFLIKRIDEHHEETRQWRVKIEERLGKTEEQLFLYKTSIRILRWLFGILFLLITFQFNDLSEFIRRGF